MPTPHSDQPSVAPTEFVSLALLSHAGGELSTLDRLRCLLVLVDDTVGKRASLFCYEEAWNGPHPTSLSEDIDSLDDSGLIDVEVAYTFGGDQRRTFILTEKGKQTTATIAEESSAHRAISQLTSSVIDEYATIPLSNLIDDVRTRASPA